MLGAAQIEDSPSCQVSFIPPSKSATCHVARAITTFCCRPRYRRERSLEMPPRSKRIGGGARRRSCRSRGSMTTPPAAGADGHRCYRSLTRQRHLSVASPSPPDAQSHAHTSFLDRRSRSAAGAGHFSRFLRVSRQGFRAGRQARPSRSPLSR